MGGVLAGRAITERPDLFAAANVAVGIVNPVRILAAENGANQKTELGDPETEVGFKSIYEMDPYHHVQAGTKYPAVIFTVGLNDRRVAPWMTAKVAARMQATTASGKPVLCASRATRATASARRAIRPMRRAPTSGPSSSPLAAIRSSKRGEEGAVLLPRQLRIHRVPWSAPGPPRSHAGRWRSSAA
jgi:hypothetical protein